ncbi:hypothetical protein HMPREF1568_2324 [Providencia alcalifaciens PAL-3]|nr:hypothetical protein HMPREF1568_2324 [Providencia alcalifaciens PAL-3]EUC98518.1 hypothetical protein HMPREF1566_0023 [Providencia alcalifaciens PAL-1]
MIIKRFHYSSLTAIFTINFGFVSSSSFGFPIVLFGIFNHQPTIN